jgi:hypothetical protein
MVFHFQVSYKFVLQRNIIKNLSYKTLKYKIYHPFSITTYLQHTYVLDMRRNKKKSVIVALIELVIFMSKS